MKTRSKPLEGKSRFAEEGAKRSKETREFRERLEVENKKQTARKEVEHFRTRSNSLARDVRISAEGANRSKETRISTETWGFENK